jgi:hypothetical protein
VGVAATSSRRSWGRRIGFGRFSAGGRCVGGLQTLLGRILVGFRGYPSRRGDM